MYNTQKHSTNKETQRIAPSLSHTRLRQRGRLLAESDAELPMYAEAWSYEGYPDYLRKHVVESKADADNLYKAAKAKTNRWTPPRRAAAAQKSW